MVVDEKNNSRQLGIDFKKMLNKKNPLDHLILEFGKEGVLKAAILKELTAIEEILKKQIVK